MENIKLPISVGIIVDDVGWHKGADERYINLPARSGLPRNHHPDDVRALNEIGRALNTKIICSLVLAEWDKNNILRGVKNVTPDPDLWDAAGELDEEYAKEYFKALEESEYLDYSLHGLFHSYYEDDGKLNTARQYYPNEKNERGEVVGYRWLSPERFDEMISLFFSIYNDWGFKKKITQFVSPCGCWGTDKSEGNIEYAKVLRKYGIKYWSNGWVDLEKRLGVAEGIMTVKGANITAWNAYDVDPDYLQTILEQEPSEPIYPYYCGHLTNFIRFDYQKNFEYTEKWAEYFRRYTSSFGTAPARNVDEACSQLAYAENARITKDGDVYKIDLTGADKLGAVGLLDEFLVSFKGSPSPKLLTNGAEIELYDEKSTHTTFKIRRGGASIIEIKL